MADIYISIMYIYNKFIDSSISGSNIKHSILYFNKENAVVLKNKYQEKMPTTMLAYR